LHIFARSVTLLIYDLKVLGKNFHVYPAIWCFRHVIITDCRELKG